MAKDSTPVIFVVSDSIGETAELVVRAAVSQFPDKKIEIRRVPYAMELEVLKETVQAAKEVNGSIAFTLVVPEMKQFLLEECQLANIECFDILSPMIASFAKKFDDTPMNQPGLVHRLDEEYFRKIEAIEFAVKYDDGKDPRGLLRADVVLIGVSRTSKTPLSMYLAHKGYKVANIPLVPEVEPPEELFTIPKGRCIGLTIDPNQLNEIRRERLRSLGLTSGASYANMSRILEELFYAERIIEKVGCVKIDVTNRAVEETASLILEKLER